MEAESKTPDWIAAAQRRSGPVAPYLETFVTRLESIGYARSSVRVRLNIVADLGEWMKRSDIPLASMSDEVARRFIARRRRRLPPGSTRATVHYLLAMMAELDLLRAQQPTRPRRDTSALGRLQRDYACYLTKERGLAPASVTDCWYSALRFVRAYSRGGRVRFKCVTEFDVTMFLSNVAAKGSRRRAQTEASLLRTFFRYLLQRGLIDRDLAAAVPRIPNWALAGVPRYISASDVERLVQAPDRNTALGRRDRAILRLMARLGLRAVEVIALQLDDVDWRAGELLIRGKGQRHERVPLPAEVGQALAEYVRKDRRGPTRRLFVRSIAPRIAFVDGQAVNEAIRRAARRVGMSMPPNRVGSHVLRHSLATNMLRGGASMREIGELLRHRSPQSTAIYAKVDIEGLRTIAQPWPIGGAR